VRPPPWANTSAHELHRRARRAERVISIENHGGMAKLGENPADQEAPKGP
jgi:hypothetical protein